MDSVNNSIFTVSGRPPMAVQPFAPVNTGIIESQTLFINQGSEGAGIYIYGTKEDEYKQRLRVHRNNGLL